MLRAREHHVHDGDQGTRERAGHWEEGLGV